MIRDPDSAYEPTVEQILLERIRSLEETNRSLHRRLQAGESPWKREIAKANADRDFYKDWIRRSFSQYHKNREGLGELYKEIASFLGHAPYQWVVAISDCSMQVRVRRDGRDDDYEIPVLVSEVIAKAKSQ